MFVKKIIFISLVLLLLGTPVVAFSAPPPWAGIPGGPNGGGDELPPENPIIIIDPGHGGSGSGSTQCSGYPEKEANLDIAKLTKPLLENVGFEVHLTRTDDSTKSNNDRYTFANSMGGNALVSIHLNGSTDHAVNGTQGFYGKKNKDEAFTKVVHEALVSGLSPINDRGVTNFPSGVLLKSHMPTTLVEAVFISNTHECQLLTDGTGDRQQEIAEAVVAGVINWFEN